MDRYDWRPQDGGFVCERGDITLVAMPEHTRRRAGKLIAAPKSPWRAQCSIWDAATSTISRYGRDAWRETPATAKDAKALAISIYEEAREQ